MKLVTKRTGESGSVLFVTLFIASLFGFFLYSYLNIVRGQRAMVARSQAWNGALAMAEAGAEEALAHLNPGAPRRRVTRAGNGWALANGYYGPVVRELSAQESYGVVFSDVNFPKIYSTGYVAVPSIPANLKRVIEVCTTNSPMFTAALAARYNIDMKGNGIETDSFNSMNPDLLVPGRYDAAHASTNGDVASIGGLVNVGNANINGAVLLGPTASAELPRSGGEILNGVNNDFNVEFEDVILPENYASWVTATALVPPRTTEGDTNTYDYIFDTASVCSYTINDLKGSIYVGPTTVVTLLLNGDAKISNIRIAGVGAAAGNLTIYMTGSSFSLSGRSVVDSGNALNFTYYGAPSNTQIIFSGNASVTGVIYAPEADFKMGGGGSDGYDFVGAVTVKSAQINGHFKFHFDENLMLAGPKKPYVATSWREL